MFTCREHWVDLLVVIGRERLGGKVMGNSVTELVHFNTGMLLYTLSTVNSYLVALNVVVEWLTPLLLIRQVPGSNIGPETDCPD
jgi:hypothetical protein